MLTMSQVKGFLWSTSRIEEPSSEKAPEEDKDDRES